MCGWSEHLEVLEVHHIDGDRSNGDIDNLVVLCPNHHAVVHLMTKTGRFKRSKEAAFPNRAELMRDLLPVSMPRIVIQ